MEIRTMIRWAVFIVLLLLLVAAVCISLSQYWNTDAPMQFLAVAVALISFFGFLVLLQTDRQTWRLTEAMMRTAIAGSIVLVYLTLVAIVAFFKVGPQQLPPISETLITNFTTIVGVVIASYFGASAYVEAQSIRQGRDKPDETKDKSSEKP